MGQEHKTTLWKPIIKVHYRVDMWCVFKWRLISSFWNKKHRIAHFIFSVGGRTWLPVSTVLCILGGGGWRCHLSLLYNDSNRTGLLPYDSLFSTFTEKPAHSKHCSRPLGHSTGKAHPLQSISSHCREERQERTPMQTKYDSG